MGGLLSFFGALTYAELGSVRPYAGGEYVYVRDAYGPLPAFLYGWTWFLIAKPASIASVTAGLVRVLGTFSAFHFLPETLFSFHITSSRVLVITYGHLVAIAANVFITGLNYIGIRKAGGFQLAFTVLKVGMIVAIAVITLTAASGSWSNFGTSFAGATGGMTGFMAALVAALWAYDGWNDLNMTRNDELCGFHVFDPDGFGFDFFFVAIVVLVDVGFATGDSFKTPFGSPWSAIMPSRFFITL